jgi:anti-anti-sigma factor
VTPHEDSPSEEEGSPSESEPEAPAFGVSVVAQNGVQIVSLQGELDLACADRFSECLATLSTSAPVIFELSRLSFIDSSGLTVLVREYKRHEHFAVTNPQPNVADLLRMTGLSMWIEEWDPSWGPLPAAPDADR